MPSSEAEDVPTMEEATAALRALASGFGQPPLRGHVPPPAPPAIEPAFEPWGLVVVDGLDRVQALDAQAEQLFQCSAADAVARPVHTFIELRTTAPNGSGVAIGRDGTRTPVQVARHSFRLGADPAASVLVMRRPDTVDRTGARSDLRYRNLVEQIPAVVFTAALEGGAYDIYVGPQIESLLGYTQEEWLREPVLWYERLHPEDRQLLDQEFARGCATGGPFRAECRFIAADGRIVWVHGEARLIRDADGFPLFLQGVAFDITETKRAEDLVRESLREKELLLKEIHHRVKNNLQVTSSLLRLQAAKVGDEGARQTLRESQDRIRSIALVHEMLYRSHDLSRVGFAEYVKALLLQLFRSYNADSRGIRHVIDVGEVELGIDVAVPCGLILNELVANALKHAFSDGRAGKIEVLMKAEPSRYLLTVRDDGVGLPPGLDPRRTDTLGLQLVRTLADQLEGDFRVGSEGGTEVTVTVSRESKA
jgi:PAS domain S-box-containing protein